MITKGKKELVVALERKLHNTSHATEKAKEYTMQIHAKYNLPLSVVSDYITGRLPLSVIDEEMIFPIASVVFSDNELRKYYTETQINNLSKRKYTIGGPKLNYRMIQVNENQWIGKITVQDLMSLFDSGKIRYNERTQRPLRRVIHHKVETWQIDINNTAIDEMVEAFKAEKFVPNTLTFNVIGSDEESGCNYNPETLMMDLSKAKYLDIIDGFHRLFALSIIYHVNPEFDYPMEMRLLEFTEVESEGFIFQEDKKTPMKKIVAKSFDGQDPGYIVVKRLCRTPEYDGIISRTGKIIDESILIRAVSDIYFTSKKNNPERINMVYIELNKKLWGILQSYPQLFTTKWSQNFIVAVINACKQFDGEALLESINNFINGAEDAEKQYFKVSGKYGKVINMSAL